jgi:hypothetical protein
MRRLGLAVLVVLAVACSTDPAPAPPIPTAGVLTLPPLLHRPDLVDVDVGPTGGDDWWSAGELVVIGLDRPADSRYVVQATPPPSVDLPGVEIPNRITGLDVGGHPAVLDTYGRTPGCGRNVLTVTVAPDARLVVAGVTQHGPDDLKGLAAELDVVDGRIVTSQVDPARGRIGRLGADWMLGDGGSRITVGHERYLVRRADPAEQRLVAAVRCPDPEHQLTPPASTDVRQLAPYLPRRHQVARRTVDTGVSGDLEVAVVRGRRGAVVLSQLGFGTLPGPGPLARLAGRVATRPEADMEALDARTREQVVDERGRSLDRDIAGEGGTVVARGHDGDLAWILARRSQRYLQGAVPPELCWSVVATIDGAPGYGYMTECLAETATGVLVPAPTGAWSRIDHLWAAVGDGVAAVVVERPGRPVQRVVPVDTSSGPIRHVVVVALEPAARAAGFVQGDLLRKTYVLQDGAIVLRALDAQGRELAAVAVGKPGCPVPPGCAP